MVKKKGVRKIKELSVVGSVSGEPQQQTPRKRGRPRKIVAEAEEKQAAKEAQDVEETEAKDSEDKEKTGEEGFPSSKKEEGSLKEKESSDKELPRKSRARRKNKPRKSS